MYLNLLPTLWPKTNSCAKLIYVLNICNKTSTKFAFVLVYRVVKCCQRAPKMAVPMRTMVLPSAMAMSKSSLMPIDNSVK